MNYNLEFENEDPCPDSIEDNHPRTNYGIGNHFRINHEEDLSIIEESKKIFGSLDYGIGQQQRLSWVWGAKSDITRDYWYAKFQQELLDTSKVNRVEVIQHSEPYNGRAYTNYIAKDVEIQLQDESRTLKIFLK